jgi:tripartite-type tricarboxylate transporter receptor subunit TctC
MLALAFTLAGQGAPYAADFPDRPITLIVPYAAGGSSDLSARPYTEEMSKILKQPLVVVNKPGAGGGIGAAEVARARGNGYTLLNASIGNVTIVPYTSKVGYDYTAFKAVAQMTDIPLALTVKADSPIKDLKGFVEYARNNPGKIRYGSPGAGNIQHVTLEGWSKKIGIQLVHMPYEGANPAVAALLGGHVESTFTGVTEVAPHAKSGALRILAITSAKRIDMVDAPTFKEQGHDLEAGLWYGVLAPKATPDDVVKILADALKKAYDSPKVQDAWKKLFLIPAYRTPAELDARIKKEAETHQQVLKDIGLHRK